MNNKQRLLQLDSLRFFALLVIVVSHFEFLKDTTIGTFYEKFLHNPTWGVDYFFLLSGFGLFYVNKDKELSNNFKSSISFAISKIKKIYFLYITSLIISIPYNYLHYKVSVKNIVIKFFVDLTLCQSCFGTISLSHGINDVCWFLSSLFICYIFSPLLINIIKKNITDYKKSIITMCTTILVILVLSGFALLIESINFNGFSFNDFFYGSPYIRLFYVLIGMLCANVYFLNQEKDKDCKSNLTLVEILYSLFSILYSLFFIQEFING